MSNKHLPSSDDPLLRRLGEFKRIDHPSGVPLGPEMIQFFKQTVQKRQGKLAKIAECWSQLVPETLNEHCALESFNRGTLAVIVDTSSHLYELKQLLLSGLQQQLLIACRSAGLKKITLKSGRWYEENDAGKKVRFD